MEMNFEGAPAQRDAEEAPIERKKEGYHEATTRYRELESVIPEAEKILFRGEAPPKDERERTITKLDLQIEACKGQAEAFAQQGNPYAERGMRMLAQFKEAEKTILCLYFDAEDASPEFAEILREEHPWIESKKGKAGEDLPEVEYVQ